MSLSKGRDEIADAGHAASAYLAASDPQHDQLLRPPDGSEYRGGSSSLRVHDMTGSHGNPSMNVPQAYDSSAWREYVAGRPTKSTAEE
jgi:hypothetical protein